MKEESKLVGLGFVTGCAEVVSRGDAVLDERSEHLRSLVVCALERGD